VCDGQGTLFSSREPHAALCTVSHTLLQSQTGHVGAMAPKEWKFQVALPGHRRHRGGFCFRVAPKESNCGCEESPGQ